MTKRVALGMFLGGVVFGAIVTAATASVAWPSTTLERSYCVLCGAHREVLKTERLFRVQKRTREHDGAVRAIFRDIAGPHTHRWSRASRTDDPRATETLSEEVARGEVADLEALEAHPGMVALLQTAAHEDRERSLAWIRRILDPSAYVGAGTVALLDHPDWSWADRWRLIDSFNAQYRCRTDELSVSCTAPVGSIAAVMFQETAGVGVAVSASDWRTWIPQGFTVSVPTASATTQPTSPAPAPPPSPTGAPTSVASPDAGTDAANNHNPALSQSVSRSRTALNNNDLDGALASFRQARSIASDAPSVRSLAGDIRQRAADMANERILRGDCDEAQTIDRNLRASGISPDESMFGPFCPPP